MEIYDNIGRYSKHKICSCKGHIYIYIYVMYDVDITLDIYIIMIHSNKKEWNKLEDLYTIVYVKDL